MATTGAGLREWLIQESCDFCVKFVRIVKALILDLLIALAVLGIARVVELAIVHLFHGDLSGQVFLSLDTLLKIATFAILGAMGIWDAIIAARSETTPPC